MYKSRSRHLHFDEGLRLFLLPYSFSFYSFKTVTLYGGEALEKKKEKKKGGGGGGRTDLVSGVKVARTGHEGLRSWLGSPRAGCSSRRLLLFCFYLILGRAHFVCGRKDLI